MITVKDIVKTYKTGSMDLTVLKGMSLHVDAGDVLKPLLTGLVASTLWCLVGAPAIAGAGHLVRPHTKADSAAHPSAVSSDGKYIAVMTVGDAEVGQVTVYERHNSKRTRLVRFGNADSFSWVPRHGHLLVVATGGADYGEGMLAAWAGGKHFRYLRRAKHPDGDEGYIIKGIAASGQSLLYEHFKEDVEHGTTRTLRLP